MSGFIRCFDRTRFGTAAVLVVLIGTALCSDARATTVDLANNLTEPVAGYADLWGNFWPAQGFTTTATDTVIGSVRIPIRRDAGVTGGSLQLFIYDATGLEGRPGSSVTGSSAVGSLSFDAVPTTTAEVAFTGLHLSLSPSTSYFVVLKTPDLIGGSLRWNYTDSTGGLGFPSPYAGSSDSGATWFTPDFTNPQQMQVTTVPEASTCAMAFAGLACGAYSVGWRRKRA